MTITIGPEISKTTLKDFTGTLETVNYTWSFNLVTIYWEPLASGAFKPAINGTIEMIEEEE